MNTQRPGSLHSHRLPSRKQPRSPLGFLNPEVLGSAWFGLWIIVGSVMAMFPAVAQTAPNANCAGWLCGAKTAIEQAPGFQGNAVATNLIDLVFIALQFLAIIVVGYYVIQAISLWQRREDFSGPATGAVVVIAALLISNYITGYIVGTVSG